MSDRQKRIGEEKLQKSGHKAKIIFYPSGADMTVQFEDGKIIEHVSYYSFSQGTLNYNKRENPGAIKSFRLGEKCVCSNEMIATIIAYRSSRDIDVQFDDGVVVEHISYDRFFQRGVPHPDHKLVRTTKRCVGTRKRTLTGYREVLRVYDDGYVDYIDDDGSIVNHASYYMEFLRKNTFMSKQKDWRTGQIVDVIH